MNKIVWQIKIEQTFGIGKNKIIKEYEERYIGDDNINISLIKKVHNKCYNEEFIENDKIYKCINVKIKEIIKFCETGTIREL